MSSIILPNGLPAREEPSAEEGKILSQDEWEAILEKLRRAELYRIALTTIARYKPNHELKIKIEQLADTEVRNMGLAFRQDDKGENMLFQSSDPLPPFSVN